MQSSKECFDKVKKDYLKFLNQEKIYNKSMSSHEVNLKKIYIPIAFWINEKYKKKGRILFLGLSAGQGSGKTTVAAILKIILKVFFKLNVCVIILLIGLLFVFVFRMGSSTHKCDKGNGYFLENNGFRRESW